MNIDRKFMLLGMAVVLGESAAFPHLRPAQDRAGKDRDHP